MGLDERKCQCGFLHGSAGCLWTKGTAAATNVPGSREWAALWVDGNNKVWLFGGDGDDPSGHGEFYNDLWMFDPATLEWTWEAGSSTEGPCDLRGINILECGWLGSYETLGVPSATGGPGSRNSMLYWTDRQGKLWLFGGGGYANLPFTAVLDDLWQFDPVAGEWAWMGGRDVLAIITIFRRPAQVYIRCCAFGRASMASKEHLVSPNL